MKTINKRNDNDLVWAKELGKKAFRDGIYVMVHDKLIMKLIQSEKYRKVGESLELMKAWSVGNQLERLKI